MRKPSIERGDGKHTITFDRRSVVVGCASVAAATVVGASFMTFPQTAAASVTLGANTRTCATCHYWEGERSISSDGNSVIASNSGVCKNRRASFYNSQVQATDGPPSGVGMHSFWSELY
jgi:hypothetical protein